MFVPRCVTVSQFGRFPTLCSARCRRARGDPGLVIPRSPRLPRARPDAPSTHDRVSADTAADPYPHPRNGLPLLASPRLRRVPDWSPVVSRVLGRSRSRYRQPTMPNGAGVLPPRGFSRREKAVLHLFELL